MTSTAVLTKDVLEKQPKSAAPVPIKALTGLRFLPLMAIVWHHARDFWMPWRGLCEEVAFVHFVTLFFVLSGFILTYRYSYVKDIGSSMHFYLARIARLWPMHAVCLILLVRLMPDVYLVKGPSIPIFIVNLLMMQSWIPLSKWYFSFNAPAWSSATLSFFDLAFPFLFIFGQRSKALVLAATAAVVVCMICVTNALQLTLSAPDQVSMQGMIFVNPLTRLLEFAVGVTAALAYKSLHQHNVRFNLLTGTMLELCAIGLVASVNVYCHPWKVASTQYIGPAGAYWLYNSGSCMLPLAFLITTLAMQRGLISKFLASKPMSILGDLSFSLFMLHLLWIAYFNTSFHPEYTLNSSIFFFGSLIVSAHIMNNLVVHPLRLQLLKHGTWLLNFKWPSPTKLPAKKPKTREQQLKQRLVMAAEVVAAALMFYFALPTIAPLSAADAAALSANASVHDVQFEPWLRCDSAQAALERNEIAVDSIWQAKKGGSVNSFITAKVMSTDGHQITELRYAMDGRHTFVSPGRRWKDSLRIEVPAGSKPAKVLISVTRGKWRKLTPSSSLTSQIQDAQMIIPVNH